MKLKEYQQKALKLIREIWNDDIEYGHIFISEDGGFSELTIADEQKNLDVMESSGQKYQETYKIDSYKALFLLRDCELIDELKENRILKFATELDFLFDKKQFKTQDEVEEAISGLDDEYREKLVDYIKFKNLQEKYPKEVINDSYTFRATEKCRKSAYENLEEIIKSYSEIERDPLIGTFNDVQLKKSGIITYKKLKVGNVKPNSGQYDLFRALLSARDKSKAMTITMILQYLNKPVDESTKTLLLPVDDYQNLNKKLKKYKIPFKISKDGDGYMFKTEHNQ